MYDKELCFSIPDEKILNFTFLKREEYYPQVFDGKQYTIVGNDDVDNMIGVDSEGRVWFLDTEMIYTIYSSKDLKTFIDQLEVYVNWVFPDDNAPDDVIKSNVEEFKCEILKSNEFAFSDNKTFWSLTIEQIEDSY